MSDFNRQLIEEFRANQGRLSGMFEGARLLLLTTTGARSGRPHTTPAAYHADDDRLLIYASNRGADEHPAWYFNLRANPEVQVELGAETFQARATIQESAERDRLFAEQVARDPRFGEYEAATNRVIPVIALTRIEARVGAATAHLKAIHQGLRDNLASLRASVDDYLSGQTKSVELPQLVDDLRTHCLAFCGSLRAHHTREDSVFDQLNLGPAADRLRREHEIVAELNDQIADLVGQLGNSDGNSDGKGDDARLRDELARLSDQLEAHFDYEEAHLGPALDAA
ncbi:nitroreductase/quinone reductase family protein [Kribbella sp. NBC_01245]|uniref:nitroreductase/quinone reductase family protein n=1 Tax=Kribbella sp. NBC_01245 TaxID=2903578 RepID=UPI002E2B0B88|nr:nitroreductase/quinone reductase family protein [Kribbella sp. NBC_01245]